MVIKKHASVGQIIRRIRSNQISPVYALYGGDSFLEDYFISELTNSFLDKNQIKIQFSLDQDSEANLFRELSSISMFEEKRLIVVREIKKISNKTGRKELIDYLNSPNTSIVLVIINIEFDIRNSLLREIANKSDLLDLRTPFKDKMEEWVKYIISNKRIRISKSLLQNYIQIYGDSLSNVINEIEKTSILLNDKEINENSVDEIKGYRRLFQLWHLQNSLGQKQLNVSLEIYSSLLENGLPLQRVIISLVYLFQQMLWIKMGGLNSQGFTGLNKIITSNLKKYSKIYSYDEIENAIYELQKVDILSKSTSINARSLIEPLIIRICNNSYA